MRGMGQNRSNRLASILPWILLPTLLCVGFGVFIGSFDGRVALQDVLPAFLLSMWLPLLALIIALPLSISIAVLLHRRRHARDSFVLWRVMDALAAMPPIVSAYTCVYLFTRLGIPYSSGMAVALLVVAFLPRLSTQALDSLKALPQHAYSAIRALGGRRVNAVYRMLLRQARAGITNGALLFVLNGLNELALMQIAFGFFLDAAKSPVCDPLPISILVRNGITTGNMELVAVAGVLLFSADILLAYAAKRALGGRT